MIYYFAFGRPALITHQTTTFDIRFQFQKSLALTLNDAANNLAFHFENKSYTNNDGNNSFISQSRRRKRVTIEKNQSAIGNRQSAIILGRIFYMAVKVGINGFGRIGRNVLRASIGDADIDFVAVNDLTDTRTLAHLLKYDSLLGNLDHDISATENTIKVDNDEFKVFAEKDPALIDWESVGAEIVIESTGRFTKAEDAKKHIRGTVKKVIISAPAKNEDITIVLGVNQESYDPANHHIISNASCTTNCLAPVAKVIHEKFGIKNAQMTTIHSYTNDQQLLDFPHKDLRRARAAAMSMIPTSTGAAKAVALVLPELKGKFDGISVRVPTPNVSLVDVVMEVEKETSLEEVNTALKDAANEELHGILAFSEEPLVSIDFRKNSNSSIVDADYTKVIGGNMVKVLSWYDNEWGYSCRVVDLIKYIASKGL
jgi:glyceraldehyde 3-phosphate dehydrogenase